MKLRDVPISIQLKTGLCAILAFIVILGMTAWWQADSLWQETKGQIG